MGISQSYIVTDCTRSTRRGRLSGITVGEKESGLPVYERYTRIRYALPPTGDWRWKKPRPLHKDWRFGDGQSDGEPEDCRSFGPICPQVNAGTIILDNPKRTEAIDNKMDEDCLFLNIWVPIGVDKPKSGFPVLFDFPGGRHQSGHGMQQDFLDPADKMRETRDTPHIIVSVNARVGVLGFLAVEHDGLPQIKGNFGFWDIRLALEWVHENISLFGGNPENIVAGGLGPATLFQLHYDVFKASKRIIRRVIFLGDVPLAQPTRASHSTRKQQFQTLLRDLSIFDHSQEDLMTMLRNESSKSLLKAVKGLDFGFMPVTDDDFVSNELLSSVWDGSLGRQLKKAGVQVLIGDTSEERKLYEYFVNHMGAKFRFSRAINSPEVLFAKLQKTVCPDEKVIASILAQYHDGREQDWTQIYCDIMADTGTYAATRCLVSGLFEGGMTTKDVLRYQIAWRPACLDEWLPPATGVFHAVEVPIWWYSGFRLGFSDEDKAIVRTFMAPINRFIVGDVDGASQDWKTHEKEYVRAIRADGQTSVVHDDMWSHQTRVWQAVRDVQQCRKEAVP